METQKNVPAPDGHCCNPTWADDATSNRIAALSREIHKELLSMYSAVRQENVLQMAKNIIERGYH